ncbi:MAG TPA: EAL domain-containing protein [Croceibacterium sp.]|nr:EAL domain-containing protein [Croceibacterium sp.]
MRAKLVATLYTHPISLLLGAMCGVAASTTAAIVSREPFVVVCAVLLIAVAVMRVGLAYWIAWRPRSRDTALLERLYEAGAFSYALLSGLITAGVLVLVVDPHVDALMCTYAVAYGTGISARNAGRPFIAMTQLLLSVMPVVIGCLIVGSFAMIVLAISAMLMIVAMASVIMSVFRTFKEQIMAAETSAKLAEKMQTLARTDVVTSLANRAGLNHELVEIMMARDPTSKLALFWLDLDRFKEVNDTLGHPVGDRVLAEVARRLKETAHSDAIVARFGGDEFIVARELASRADSERLAGRILEEINRPFRIDGERLELGCSMGIALLPDDGQDIDTLMQGADLALYHAKINGKNQVRFFDPAMNRDLVRKKEIEAELRAALQRDELSIFFQPIVDLETGHIRTFEALVRWFHPEKGELRPDEFIPVAEETGVIITLGNWITAQAAKAAAQWPEDVTLAVNLSPVQIRAPGAALGILTALRDAKLDPRRLELEVTESLFIDDNQHTARFIEDLSAEGVRFALDDFGTGYSSLGYINKFPFKKIKVDRSFVSGPNVGLKSDAIIRAVAEMGSTLEMEIVAEGLETIDQVHAVRAAGCTLGQGYYFSRAVPDYLAAMLLAQEKDSDPAARLAS